MPFKNRKEAGERLAQELSIYRRQDVLVLAIPRGGVEVACEVAKSLEVDLDIVIVRKLPFPEHPEAGFGAVAEDGSTFLFPDAHHWISAADISRITEEQRAEIARRIAVLRGGRSLSPIAGRAVLLVDDGIAMGATMRAAIMLCKHGKARRIVVAAPVSGSRVRKDLRALADEIRILESPLQFRAVAEVYENWYDVSDEEVIELLDRQQSEFP